MIARYLLVIVSAVVIVYMLFPVGGTTQRYLMVNGGQILIACISGAIGLQRARSYGMKSIIGKAYTAVSFGVWWWGIGALIWLHYNLAGVELPFPSPSDIGFIAYYPFMLTGAFLLIRNFSSKRTTRRFPFFGIAGVIAFIVTVWLFLHIFRYEATLSTAFNAFYLGADVLCITSAICLLERVRGGVLFVPLRAICYGLIFQGVGDIAFSFMTEKSIYFTGSFPDILYALSLAIVGFGLSSSYTIPPSPRKQRRTV